MIITVLAVSEPLARAWYYRDEAGGVGFTGTVMVALMYSF